MHLRLKQNPSLINDVISITPDDIKIAIQNTSFRRSKCMKGNNVDVEFTDGLTAENCGGPEAGLD